MAKCPSRIRVSSAADTNVIALQLRRARHRQQQQPTPLTQARANERSCECFGRKILRRRWSRGVGMDTLGGGWLVRARWRQLRSWQANLVSFNRGHADQRGGSGEAPLAVARAKSAMPWVASDGPDRWAGSDDELGGRVQSAARAERSRGRGAEARRLRAQHERNRQLSSLQPEHRTNLLDANRQENPQELSRSGHRGSARACSK